MGQIFMTNKTNIPGQGLLSEKNNFNEQLDGLIPHKCIQTNHCDILDGARDVLQGLVIGSKFYAFPLQI